MQEASPVYLAVGANRQSAAADWSSDGTLCFGAGVNIALWRPTLGIRSLLRGHTDTIRAVQFLAIQGQTYIVSSGDDRSLRLWAVDAVACTASCVQTIEAAHGAPVNCLAVAREGAGAEKEKLENETVASQHVSVRESPSRLVVSGAADATIRVWSLQRTADGDHPRASHQLVLVQTMQTSPRYFPQCLALVALEDETVETAADRPSSPKWLLAAAGTNTRIQLFVNNDDDKNTEKTWSDFTLQATLRGHEDWIRSLDFCREEPAPTAGKKGKKGDLLLASASQDYYIRLWRIHRLEDGDGDDAAEKATGAEPLAVYEDPLSTLSLTMPSSSTLENKKHTLTASATSHYAATFEALLMGHDDWIYTVQWDRSGHPSPRLLSASADNSLAVWEADADSGIWVTTARLGELSKEKGATTATGSVGGFWAALWSPTGRSVVTLCRTGSWRRWDWDTSRDYWRQAVGLSGHTAAVTGVAWSGDGSYLLSTSRDQTTRLHAEWRRPVAELCEWSWHEMARPQIHGYDLNCIDALGTTQFVSGADEKLMRVFREPRTVARLLARLTGAVGRLEEGASAALDALPEAANMPVLGLSNKVVDREEEEEEEGEGEGKEEEQETQEEEEGEEGDKDEDASAHVPPPEDVLSRNLLWPETEKLYGHGYEISCLAVSHDGSVVASACRASSLNHAVVRLFETERWTELRPPLQAHTLTATRLRFSADDRLLLSVGRDRQWAVYERVAADEASAESRHHYVLREANAKAHTRMLLDCAWAPLWMAGRQPGPGPGQAGRRVFATAGRDKNIKIWATPVEAETETRQDTKTSLGFALATAIPQDHPVTAVDFLWRLSTTITERPQPHLVLAVGTEAGRLSVLSLDTDSLAVVASLVLDVGLCLPKAVLQLAWRPPTLAPGEEGSEGKGADLAIAGEDASLRVYRIQR